MRNRLIFIISIVLMCCGTMAFAQKIKVSGTVIDENASALPGTIVVVKSGSATGSVVSSTTTDAVGRYTVECSPKDYIGFHFLGYQEVAYPVNGKSKIDVTMNPDVSQKLDDVVVIGYGAVKKADLTGSVTNVKMAEIRDEPVLSVDQALQGRVAGMVITSTDGEPGSDSVIRIRGSRSITASNDPLIIVDGVMDAVTSLSDVNPSDIEAISVLKDASSTAIYGARGANGVIIITTKGSADSSEPSQKISVTLKAQAGFSMLPSNLDLMNAEEYSIFRNDYLQHSGISPNMNYTTPIASLSVKNPYSMGQGEDWIKDVVRVAPYQNYNISMNGFQGKTKFYASLAYNDEQGIIKRSGKQNFSGTLNVTNDCFKWLRLYANLRYQYRLQDNNLTAIGGTGIYYSAQYLSPLIDPDSSYNPLANAGTEQTNAVVRLKEKTDQTDRSMLNISIGANVKFTKTFKFKTKLSYYYFDRKRFEYSPSTMPSRKGMGGYAYQQSYGEQSLYTENTFEYSNTWNKHHFDASLGQTWKHFTSNTLSLEGEGYLVDAIKWNDMSAVKDKASYGASSGSVVKDKAAFFFRANYNWRSRYYLTVTGRADGASNFSANHKWGVFPSGAVKWVISNEPFMKNAQHVDDLSIRISAGQSGNDLNKAYRSLANMDSGSGGYPFGGQLSQEYWQNRIASPNLTWETTTLYNLAIDGTFFNNRLSFTFEAYKSFTEDLLLDVKTVQTTGYDSKYQNIGKTSSKGLELSINSRNIVKRNFTWTTDFTISTSNSIVNDIGPESEVSAKNSPTGGYMNVGYKVGYPVNAFWGFQYAGVWHNDDEIERNKVTRSYANAQATTKLGSPIYLDQNHDGVLDSNDIVYLGSPDPIISGGLQNTFRWRGLSIGIFFSYAWGGKVLNFSEYYMSGSRRTNQYAYMVNAWHPYKNPESNLPRAGIWDSTSVPSSFLIHDASYIRLKTLSIGYRFNIKSKVLREIEVTASGENLYLWSNYNGFDPDVSSGGVNGYDVSSYPKPRRVVFSVQLKY